MINESDLRAMSAAERRELAHLLTVIDYPSPLRAIQLSRGRWVGGLAAAIACAVLAAWIVVLFLTLNRSFHAQHWKGAWAGFDVIELVAFAATGWAFWRVRQVVIPCLLVTGTLLCCDAWFDVVLDTGTPDVWGSVASALLIELPLAFIMFGTARRLIRLSAVAAMAASGDYGDFESMPEERLPPLWKVPLFGVGTPERWPGARTGRLPRGDPGGRASQRDRSAEDHTSTEVDRPPRSDLTSSPWGYGFHFERTVAFRSSATRPFSAWPRPAR